MSDDDVLATLKAKLSDRYEIERELGRGGMATVYLAKDPRHDREVAIKVLHPDLSATIGAERFEREIRLAAKLQHPHILTLYDSGSVDGLLYYVMPFVKGESVRDRLDREKQLPIDDALQIILEVADALGYAHAQDIIHRDIKPENILISNGHALVADFGIARARTEAGGQKLTQTGMAVGTPVYMSPEQSTGEEVGPSADIYSLGCMLYEMLAGDPPFTGKTSMAIMAKHAMEMVPSVRVVRASVPEEVEEAIFAAMEKSPADRPRSAAAFSEILGIPLGATATRRVISRQTATRRIPSGAQRRYVEPVPVWRRPAILMGAIAGLLLGGGAVVWSKVANAPRAAAGDPLSKKVAVLYFEDPSGQMRDVADRLTDALIRDLQSINQLTVSSRNAVEPFRDPEIPEDSIAKKLNVGTIVTGMVRLDGPNNVRVTTSLFDAQTGRDVSRSTTHTVVNRDSLLTAEGSVTKLVTERLRLHLGAQLRDAEVLAGPKNDAAYTSFLRGEKARKDAERLVASNRDSATVLAVAADSLARESEDADARWVEPVLLRGDVAYLRNRLAQDTVMKIKWLDSAKSHGERALGIDASNAKALALRGAAKYREYQLSIKAPDAARNALLDAAEQDLQTAVRNDPTLASAYATLTFVYYDKKNVPESLAAARAAYKADAFLSNTADILNRLFWSAYDTQGFAEANTACDDGARRFPGNVRFTSCKLWLLFVPGEQPKVEEAWALAHRVDSLSPEGFQAQLARIVVSALIARNAEVMSAGEGQKRLLDSAEHVLQGVRTARRKTRDLDPNGELTGYEAIARIEMNQQDAAISLFREYVLQNPTHSFCVRGNVHWWWQKLTPNPKFASLMARCNVSA